MSSHVYEIIRTIYNTTTADSTDEARVAVLQQTLSQLRLTNIATLDACMNHFTRLIDLTSADEDYVQNLASTLAPCILRPRIDTSLTMEEKHACRLIRDLFAHKDAIFGELKRMSTLSHTGSVSNNRPRAISTDESNRRAHMEERQRALLEKAGPRGRATSPAPGPRHRRDRSTGGPETRFPIASPTATNERQRSSLGTGPMKRQSLEVPDGSSEVNGGTNGDSPKQDGESIVSKRDSLSRTGATSTRFVGGRRVTQGSTPSTPKIAAADARPGSETPTKDRGVTLVDAPMND